MNHLSDWIIPYIPYIAVFALACAAALVWLVVCEFRAAEVHEEWAEPALPRQREPMDPTTLAVVWDEREDGKAPESLTRIAS